MHARRRRRTRRAASDAARATGRVTGLGGLGELAARRACARAAGEGREVGDGRTEGVAVAQGAAALARHHPHQHPTH
eukprot:scaffold1207_cov188-Prasinococcus_capsulatus_cf.AAC.1